MSAEIHRRIPDDFKINAIGSSLTVAVDLKRLIEARSVEIKRPRVPVEKVLIAQPLGYCAGVEMAITALDEMVRLHPEEKVYCYHEIAHNDGVRDFFTRKGVVFVKDIKDIPDKAPIMLSAHGSSPGTILEAQKKGAVVVDAVCPLVKKVHNEIKVRSREGQEILYIGHEGHDETIGAQGYSVHPDHFHLIQSVVDIQKLAEKMGTGVKTAIVMQTTLAQGEWEPLVEAARSVWPDIWRPRTNDICYATTNRQEAVKRLVREGAETILVVTAKTSANGNALVRVAQRTGTNTFPVLIPEDLPDSLEGIIGISASASAPVDQIFSIVNLLDPKHGFDFTVGDQEEEKFRLPVELRRLKDQKNKALQ